MSEINGKPNPPGLRINMTLVYQILAVVALAASGFSEFVRMGDRIGNTEKQLEDIAEKAARIPTVEQRLSSLELDTLKRSGPITDEVSTINSKIVRLEQIVLIERPNILSEIQKRMDAIELRLIERAKAEDDIRRDVYLIELRRNRNESPVDKDRGPR